MKIKQLLLASAFCLTAAGSYAQTMTVDQILDNYFENIGGKDKLSDLEGIKMEAKVNQGGMEIPLEIVQTEDGSTYTKITFQGKNIMQNVFDGETLWNTNFQTMQAEKADDETTANLKLESNDFPDSFLDYKDKGYTAELMGTETVEGTETYKIKLVKEPILVDGNKVENVVYYFFDTENFVPIMQESEVKTGPMKGQIQQITFSDYQEVDGLYFPFSMGQGIKGMGSQPLTITSITTNPDVDDEMFEFPESNN
jgi:hypothetical protein